MDNIVSISKILFEKTWAWFFLMIFSLTALFNDIFFKWVGFDSNQRWIVGSIAVLSFSIIAQKVADYVKECLAQSSIIKSIDLLPSEAIEELKQIVISSKKTLKIKDNNFLEQKRIISHFHLNENHGYVVFPDYLWKELIKRFKND